jgi:hypothetical protein
MMRLRRASVLLALFLLAWAGTASSECAWVLWYDYHIGSAEIIHVSPTGPVPAKRTAG